MHGLPNLKMSNIYWVSQYIIWSPERPEIVLFSKTLRLALGSTQLPIQ